MQTSSKTTILPILFGFFVMGFVDVVGIATNHVKADFNLSDSLTNLIPMMVFLWFAIFSIPVGILMGKTGRRNTVAIALFITTVAMLIPLFLYNFIFVLITFALLGIGNTILQVSLNPMVANIVSHDKMTSVLTLGQFIKAISSFLGPIIAGIAASFWGDWKLIFMIYLITSLLSAIWLLITVPGKEKLEKNKVTFATTLSLFKDKLIVWLFLGILFIVGIDVGLNTSIPKLLMDKTNMSLNEAGLGTSLYFAARTIGTFIGAIILAKFTVYRFFKISMGIAIASFITLLIFPIPWVMFTMIVIVGLACSNVFPIIFSYALQYKRERTNEISALMIMGVSGGSLITPFMGIVSDGFGQVAGLSILLICIIYLMILSFIINRNQ
ncbi:MAG: MFS transporter [Mediterranea sp.]|nr:MFS transporter [Mediterranea sp.]